MNMRTWALVLSGMLVAGCVSEAPSGPLAGQLAGRVLTLPGYNGDDSGVLQLVLHADGILDVTIIEPDEAFPFEEFGVWRTDGAQFCLRLPEGSRLASTGREECAPIMIDGSDVVLGDGPGRDVFRGTLSEALL